MVRTPIGWFVLQNVKNTPTPRTHLPLAAVQHPNAGPKLQRVLTYLTVAACTGPRRAAANPASSAGNQSYPPCQLARILPILSPRAGRVSYVYKSGVRNGTSNQTEYFVHPGASR
jgi:hypothetical protein